MPKTREEVNNERMLRLECLRFALQHVGQHGGKLTNRVELAMQFAAFVFGESEKWQSRTGPAASEPDVIMTTNLDVKAKLDASEEYMRWKDAEAYRLWKERKSIENKHGHS